MSDTARHAAQMATLLNILGDEDAGFGLVRLRARELKDMDPLLLRELGSAYFHGDEDRASILRDQLASLRWAIEMMDRLAEEMIRLGQPDD